MARPTVYDIAATAGVSVATVDRVLNRRPGVRAHTIERVEAAIVKLNYVRDIAATNLAKQRTYSLTFIVPEGPNAFMRQLESEIRQAMDRSRVERTEINLVTVPAFNSAALTKALDEIDITHVCGAAFVAIGSPDVHAAVDRLKKAGLHLVTLVSDLSASKRDHYAGIDNVAAGRTAASLLGRFLRGKAGKVAVVAGSMIVRDHVERKLGFDQVMRSEFSNLDVLPPLEGLDNGGVVEVILKQCLEEHPEIIGIYSLGAGNRGVIAALKALNIAGKLRVIAHEVTKHAREALVDGTFDAVLNQNSGHEVRSAIRVLKACADGQKPVEAQERIRIDVFLRDNLL